MRNGGSLLILATSLLSARAAFDPSACGPPSARASSPPRPPSSSTAPSRRRVWSEVQPSSAPSPTMRHGGFPRLSPPGILILATYLLIARAAFDASAYGPVLRAGALAASSPALLNGAVAATSLLNALSHSAVVLGALDDTYVLSILVGVGFDVLTRVMHLIWWIWLSAIVFRTNGSDETLDGRYAATVFFLVALSIVYGCHMVIHVRALRMNKSYDRLAGVLRSALNNLRGIPGEWFMDHIFAYTDLGGHLAPLHLSVNLLRQQEALLSGFLLFAAFIVASGLVLSRVPINDATHEVGASLVQSSDGGCNVHCSCLACRSRSQCTGERSSFTCSRRDGVCRLWLHSFGELTDILLGVSDEMDTKRRR